MANEWDAAKSSALAILGKDAKIPDPVATFKVQAEFKKIYAEYETTVKSLQDKILKLQNAGSATRNTLKQYQDQLDRMDFGLDKSDPADKAKIAKASDILDKLIDKRLKSYDDGNKALDELDKHTMALMDYKSPEGK